MLAEAIGATPDVGCRSTPQTESITWVAFWSGHVSHCTCLRVRPVGVGNRLLRHGPPHFDSLRADGPGRQDRLRMAVVRRKMLIGKALCLSDIYATLGGGQLPILSAFLSDFLPQQLHRRASLALFPPVSRRGCRARPFLPVDGSQLQRLWRSIPVAGSSWASCTSIYACRRCCASSRSRARRACRAESQAHRPWAVLPLTTVISSATAVSLPATRPRRIPSARVVRRARPLIAPRLRSTLTTT
jgi:hypothetical protein